MTIYAEEINYWQTSQTSPDVWVEKTKKLIVGLGGSILMEGFGGDANGRSAFVLAFALGGDQFKIIWPVLPTLRGTQRAARIQAATMLYHDVKAKCMSAAVLGTRASFFQFLQLPDGRTTVEASMPELMRGIPSLFLTDGRNYEDAEWKEQPK